MNLGGTIRSSGLQTAVLNDGVDWRAALLSSRKWEQ